MAEGIVQRLEIIEVNEQQTAEQSAPPAGSERLTQAVVEQTAIRQAGQRVMERHLAHLRFHLHAFRDIARDTEDRDELAVGI